MNNVTASSTPQPTCCHGG